MKTTLECVRDVVGLRALASEWDRLHRTCRGSVFQSFVWNYEWWKRYQEGLQLKVVLIRSNSGELIGLLPLFQESFGPGVVQIRRLRLVGTRYAYGEFSPLAHPDFREEASGAMAEWLSGELGRRNVHVIELLRFFPGDPVVADIVRCLRESGYRVLDRPQAIPRAMMELPKSWDAYLESLSKGERRTLGRRGRSLDRAGTTVEVVKSPELMRSAFDDFVRLHGASWQGRGRDGYFKTVEGFEAFHRKVSCTLAERGEARLYFLNRGESRIAGVYVFLINGQCCFYLSGLDRSHELQRFSPGKILLTRVVRDAIKEGMHTFDFQGGDEPYKRRLGGTDTWFARTVIWRLDARNLAVPPFLLAQAVRNFLLATFWREWLAPTSRIILDRARSIIYRH
jgi:CelD/BcsL family acetyltransferase involved in cellulose biosynthesis